MRGWSKACSSRRTLYTALTMAMAATLLIVPLRPAAAAQNCVPPGANYHVAYTTNPNQGPNYRGVAAGLTVRSGALCLGVTAPASNFNTNWVMLTNPPNQFNYSQAGYFRGYGQSTYHFSEFRRSNVDPFERRLMLEWGALGNGASYRYETEYYPGCSCLTNRAGNSEISRTWFNPYVAWPSFPWSLQWSGETIYPQSNVPGINTARTRFFDMQVEYESDGAWHGAGDDPYFTGWWGANSVPSVLSR